MTDAVEYARRWEWKKRLRMEMDTGLAARHCKERFDRMLPQFINGLREIREMERLALIEEIEMLQRITSKQKEMKGIRR